MLTEEFNITDNYKVTNVVIGLSLIALAIQLFLLISHPINLQQTTFLILFGILAPLLLTLRKAPFMVMFLISAFALITSWRLSALAGYTLATWVYTSAMLMMLLNYLLFAYQAILAAKSTPTSEHHHQVTVFEWQLLFIRLFIGFDLIPHFCEKLFAGPLVRADDIQAFVQLGVPHPTMMVMLAGLIELGGAFSLSCGLLTRLGALCLTVYLLTATYLGHHFSLGFIWASPGGGWEYPVLWTVLILSFATFGAGDFSIDRWIKNAFNPPAWIRHIMGGRKS